MQLYSVREGHWELQGPTVSNTQLYYCYLVTPLVVHPGIFSVRIAHL